MRMSRRNAKPGCCETAQPTSFLVAVATTARQLDWLQLALRSLYEHERVPIQHLYIRDLPPAVPLVELDQVVRPHQPDEAHAGIMATQGADPVGGLARAQPRLDIRDDDARVGQDLPGIGQPAGKRCGTARLQRVAGRDQPPDTIQPEAAQGGAGDGDMAFMRGIEGSPKKADRHPGQRNGKPRPGQSVMAEISLP